jgi:putative acetyltransferase
LSTRSSPASSERSSSPDLYLYDSGSSQVLGGSERKLSDLVIARDDPTAPDVTALLVRHLEYSYEISPAEHVHALDIEGLLDPAVTFFSARRDGMLVGVGAIKALDQSHAELKSMHTVQAVRGQGVGTAMVGHLMGLARERGYERVSLETGTQDGFEPARAMYRKAGFETCEPFANYTSNPHSTCMTILL